MQKRHFVQAADMVRAILNGEWTHEAPSWAPTTFDLIEVEDAAQGNLRTSYVRAVWTAEAFILLFTRNNDRFNRDTFLRACGLQEGQ